MAAIVQRSATAINDNRVLSVGFIWEEMNSPNSW